MGFDTIEINLFCTKVKQVQKVRGMFGINERVRETIYVAWKSKSWDRKST